MADVKIEIKSEADTTAIENTKSALDKLNKESGQAAGAISSVGSAVSKINPQLGATISSVGSITNGVKGLAVAFRALIATPLGAVLTGIAAAAIALKAAFDWLESSAEKARKTMARINDLQFKNALENIAQGYKDMADEAKLAANETERLLKYNQGMRAASRIKADAESGPLTGIAAATRTARRNNEDAQARTDAARANVAKFADALKRACDKLEEMENAVKNHQKSENELRGVQDEVTAASEAYKNALNDLSIATAMQEAIAAQGKAAEQAAWDKDEADRYEAAYAAREEAFNNAGIAADREQREKEAREDIAERKAAIQDRIDELEKEREPDTLTKSVGAGSGFSTGGGFLTQNASTAAAFSTTYTVENKAQATREKQLKALNRQLDKLDELVRKIDTGETTFQ